MTTPLNSLLMLTLLYGAHVQATEQHTSKHAHSAHSHGRGQLELVVQGNTVQANFEIPMESLLGFEHLPKTPAQKKAMADLQAGVTQPDYVLILPKAAACELKSVQAQSDLFLGKQSTHSDLDLSMAFTCSQPAELKQIEFPIFKKHTRLKSLKVDMLTPKGQGATTVKTQDPVLRW
jgi:hypothetical protein